MNINQAIDILTEHNKWRRALPPYDSLPPNQPVATPKEVGEAIDVAIETLKTMEEK